MYCAVDTDWFESASASDRAVLGDEAQAPSHRWTWRSPSQINSDMTNLNDCSRDGNSRGSSYGRSVLCLRDMLKTQQSCIRSGSRCSRVQRKQYSTANTGCMVHSGQATILAKLRQLCRFWLFLQGQVRFQGFHHIISFLVHVGVASSG